jgi:hypothetical protein
MIAHSGQRMGIEFSLRGTREPFVYRQRFCPLYRTIESRWMNRLGGRYVRQTKIVGGGSTGRDVYRNGHQQRWYWRWVMGSPSGEPLPPKPPAEMPTVQRGTFEVIEPMRLAA